MIKLLLIVAVLGSVSSFAGIAIAQSKQGEAFFEFHEAVSPCSKEVVKQTLKACKNIEVREWLAWYLK